jgi:hypothetical protein
MTPCLSSVDMFVEINSTFKLNSIRQVGIMSKRKNARFGFCPDKLDSVKFAQLLLQKFSQEGGQNLWSQLKRLPHA